jgi:hypothetical protein
VAVVIAMAALGAAASCGEGDAVPFGGTDVPGGEGVSDETGGQPGDVEEPDVPLADGQVCRPGEGRCMGSVFLQCNAGGSDWASFPCPAGTACKPAGCVVVFDQSYQPPPEEVIEPPADVLPTGDAQPPPQDVKPPQDVQPPSEDVTIVPHDVQPPQDTTPPKDVQGPIQCQGPNDCPQGLQCCQVGPPGTPRECRQQCGGGPNIPTCESDAECIGGQTCVQAMGYGLCVSECGTDADCGTNKCQEIGGFGYVIARVCDCAPDTGCAEGLTCCEIPYIGGTTCLTECVNF